MRVALVKDGVVTNVVEVHPNFGAPEDRKHGWAPPKDHAAVPLPDGIALGIGFKHVGPRLIPGAIHAISADVLRSEFLAPDVKQAVDRPDDLRK